MQSELIVLETLLECLERVSVDFSRDFVAFLICYLRVRTVAARGQSVGRPEDIVCLITMHLPSKLTHRCDICENARMRDCLSPTIVVDCLQLIGWSESPDVRTVAASALTALSADNFDMILARVTPW